MTFGEKLAKLRKENNYTQEQLADSLGVSRQSVSKWESDIAYPETDKLLKLGKLFNCSMDFLMNDEITEREPKESFNLNTLCMHFKEKKSKKTVFGMPLYHIGKDAKGFFAIGFKAKGIFSFGLLSRGIFSFGLLSFGILSIGLSSIGLISLGCFSIGILALGSMALGLIALGAISIGIVSCGALSIGLFSSGALAIGKYLAIGDHSHAMIAIGKSEANGSIYRYIGDVPSADTERIRQLLDIYVPSWLSWAKKLICLFI